MRPGWTLFAAGGLFFNEWYWDPIFRALVAVPFLGIVGFVTFLAVRRWIEPIGKRVLLAVGIIVGGTALILGGGLYLEYERPARESRTVARTLGFTAYEPRPLPPPFVLESARAGVGALDSPVIDTTYDAGDGFAFVTEEPRPGPGGESSAGRCLLPTVRCREVRTPKGIPVLMTRDAKGVDASAVLGGTLVSIQAVAVGEAAVLAYFDSLQPVDPTELEFSRA